MRVTGKERSRIAGIDVPKNLVGEILGVDAPAGLAPLGFDAKSSFIREASGKKKDQIDQAIVRSIHQKGARRQGGSDLFQSGLESALSGQGLQEGEAEGLFKLLKRSSGILLRGAKGFIPNYESARVPISLAKKLLKELKTSGMKINRRVEEAQYDLQGSIGIPRGSSLPVVFHEAGHFLTDKDGSRVSRESNIGVVKDEAIANKKIISLLKEAGASEENIKDYRQSVFPGFKTYKLRALGDYAFPGSAYGGKNFEALQRVFDTNANVVTEKDFKNYTKNLGPKLSEEIKNKLASTLTQSGKPQSFKAFLGNIPFENRSVDRLLKLKFAEGFVPSLSNQVSGIDAVSSGLTNSIGGLRDSINRETHGTGISMSQVRVNFSDKHGEPPVTVTNTRDEGIHAAPSVGFDRVRKNGGNIFLAGSGKEYASGYIPNLAETEEERDKRLNERFRKIQEERIANDPQGAKKRVTPTINEARQLAEANARKRAEISKFVSSAENENKFLSGFRNRNFQKSVEKRFGDISPYYEEGSAEAQRVTKGISSVNENRSNRSGRIQHLGFSAAFALPLLGGAVAQAVPEGAARRNVEGISSAVGSGIALTTLGAGIPGVIAGIAIAGLQIVRTINQNLKPSFEDLSKKTQELASKKQAEIQAVGNVVQSRNAVDEAIKNGNPNDVRLAQRAYASSLSGVNDASTRNRLVNAQDPEELQKIAAETQENAQRELARSAAISGGAGFEEKFQKGFLQGNFFGRTGKQNVSEEGAEQIKGLVQSLVAAGADSEQTVNEIRSRIHGGNKAIFNAYLEQIRETNKVVSQATEAQARYQAQVAGLNGILSRLTGQKLFSQNIGEIKADGQRDQVFNNLKNAADFYRPSTSEAAQTNVEYEISSRENERSYNKQLRGVRSELVSFFNSNATTGTPKNQEALTDLRNQALQSNKDGSVEYSERLLSLLQQSSAKGNEELNQIRIKLFESYTQFQTQTKILEDNRASARNSAYTAKLSTFLGGGLNPINTDAISNGATATAAYIGLNEKERVQSVRNQNLFGTPDTDHEQRLKQAAFDENQRGVLGGRAAENQRYFGERDQLDIDRANAVRSKVENGLIPSLASTPSATKFEDLPPDVQRLQNDSRGILEKGIRTGLYQNASSAAQADINPLIGQAGFRGAGANVALSALQEASGSRDSKTVDEAITKITAYNTNRVSDATKDNIKNGARGSSEDLATQAILQRLESYKVELRTVTPAAHEQANRIYTGDATAEAFKTLDATVKDENDKDRAQYSDLISQASLIAENTADVNQSVQKLGEIFSAQAKATNDTVSLNNAEKDQSALRNEKATNLSALAESTKQKQLIKSNPDKTSDRFGAELSEAIPEISGQSESSYGLFDQGSKANYISRTDAIRKDALDSIRKGSSVHDVATNLRTSYSGIDKADLPKDFKLPSVESFETVLGNSSVTHGILSKPDEQKLVGRDSEIDTSLKNLQPSIDKLTEALKESTSAVKTREQERQKIDLDQIHKRAETIASNHINKANEVVEAARTAKTAADNKQEATGKEVNSYTDARRHFDPEGFQFAVDNDQRAKQEAKDATDRLNKAKEDRHGVVKTNTSGRFSADIDNARLSYGQKTEDFDEAKKTLKGDALKPYTEGVENADKTLKSLIETQKKASIITESPNVAAPTAYSKDEAANLSSSNRSDAKVESNRPLYHLENRVTDSFLNRDNPDDERKYLNEAKSYIPAATKKAQDNGDSQALDEIKRLTATINELVKQLPAENNQNNSSNGDSAKTPATSTENNINVDLSLAFSNNLSSEEIAAMISKSVIEKLEEAKKSMNGVIAPKVPNA